MEPRNCTVLGAAQCEYPNTLPVRAQTACTSNYHTTAEPYATRVNGQPAVLCSQKRRALVLGLAGGVDLKTVSSNLGHAGIAITADLYAHVLTAAALKFETHLTARDGKLSIVFMEPLPT